MVGETSPTCLSYDGNSLYLVHQYYSHSDIFVSRYEGGRWTRATDLGHQVNGRTSETHASISRDGQTLYFVSDARGGQGSFDIYVSKLDGQGEWGEPSNLGPVINTPYEEHTPFISGNDSVLFFSSQGHRSIGGIDVFYSELGPDGRWMEPVSLGYPVNTTGEDVFFNPGWNELDGYYAVRRLDDPTSNTINMVIELEPVEEAVQMLAYCRLNGQAEDMSELPEETAVVKVIEPEETDEIHEVLNRDIKNEPAALPAISHGKTELQTRVPFDLNEYKLGMEAMLEIEKVAEIMLRYPGTLVHLSGHADASGDEEYNLLLSSHRAEQVSLYLESRGIDPQRISMEARGEFAPVALDTFPDGKDAPLGRYLNRQVFLTITSTEPLQEELSGVFIPSHLRVDLPSRTREAITGFSIQVFANYSPADRTLFRDWKMSGNTSARTDITGMLWVSIKAFMTAMRL